jgi:16S rRNA processing protein RimM
VPSQRHILIGRILGAHGIAGGMKLMSYAESVDVFAPGRKVIAVGAAGDETVYEIEWAQSHGRTVLLGIQGIGQRSQAEALAGCDLFFDRATLPEPEDGTYYWADLIGIEVYAAGGAFLGRIESIFQTGSNDVYVVKQKNRELLLPALRSVIKSVDVESRRMEVEVPEGLD